MADHRQSGRNRGKPQAPGQRAGAGVKLSGQAFEIGGGAARSFWLVLPGKKGAAPQGLCLLPRGTEEGVRMVLSGRRFALRLGQAVRFSLVAHSGNLPAQAGQTKW